jgi:hypothetical protein
LLAEYPQRVESGAKPATLEMATMCPRRSRSEASAAFQHVHAAPGGDHLAHGRAAVLEAGDVAAQCQRLDAARLELAG